MQVPVYKGIECVCHNLSDVSLSQHVLGVPSCICQNCSAKLCGVSLKCCSGCLSWSCTMAISCRIYKAVMFEDICSRKQVAVHVMLCADKVRVSNCTWSSSSGMS